MKEKSLERALASLAIESKAIADIAGYLDVPQFSMAVEALCGCDKIITSGCGGSGVAAKKFAHSLCCIEKNGYFLSPSEALHGGLGCVKKNDVVVLLSRGGKTAELLPIASVCNKKGATLIGVLENTASPLAQMCQIVLPILIERESDPCNIMTTTSFMVAAALFDALLAAIMEESAYGIEQFALIHPGGAVGELLNPENTSEKTAKSS